MQKDTKFHRVKVCQGGLNWIYGECTVKNVLLSMWFDLVRHGYGAMTILPKICQEMTYLCTEKQYARNQQIVKSQKKKFCKSWYLSVSRSEQCSPGQKSRRKYYFFEVTVLNHLKSFQNLAMNFCAGKIWTVFSRATLK